MSYDDRLTLGVRTCPLNREGFLKNILRPRTPEYDETPFLKYKGKAMLKKKKYSEEKNIYFYITYIFFTYKFINKEKVKCHLKK